MVASGLRRASPGRFVMTSCQLSVERAHNAA
jgi:hypothetical protein